MTSTDADVNNGKKHLPPRHQDTKKDKRSFSLQFLVSWCLGGDLFLLNANRNEEGPPPILGTWPRLYAVVVGELLLCILGFWLLARVCA